MKKLFKWSINTLFGLILTLIVVALFLLNSTQTIKWVADRYAPQYGFSYSKISGGLLTGLEVKDLSFKEDKLVESFKIGWNIIPLLYSRVAITHIDATAVDRDNIQKVVASFATDKPTEEKDDNSSFVLPITIGISKLHVNLNPLKQSSVAFKSLDLNAKDIVYRGDKIEVEHFLLTAESNITTLHLAGGLEERVVKIEKLSLLEIDTLALTKIINTLTEEENSSQSGSTEEPAIEANEEKTQENKLIPTHIDIATLNLTIKPARYPEFSLKSAELNSSMLGIDLQRILEKKSNAIAVESLTLQVESNLSTLSLESSLVQERVTIKSLSIHKIDTIALTEMFALDENSTEVEESNSSEPANPLIPKELFVEEFDCSIKSATYDPVEVESVDLNGSKISFDIPKLLAKSGSIDFNASTSFATVLQKMSIVNNQLKSRGSLTPLKNLYETYEIPLREQAIESIPIEIDANQEQVDISIVIEGTELLEAEEGAFNINALSLSSTLYYNITHSKMRVESEGNISTPYAKNIELYNLLRYENEILKYGGKIIPGELEGIDDNYTKPLKNLNISYDGNISSLSAIIHSDALIGKFVSPDFKKAEFNLTTKSPLLLNELVALPKPLQKGIANIDIHMPLDFQQITPLKADINISSNIANIDAILHYDKDIQLLSTTTLPPDTLLKGFGKEINFKAIETIQTNLTLAEQNLTVDITSQAINSNLKLNMESKDIGGNLKVVDTNLLFAGNLDGNITLNHEFASLQALIKNIHSLYAFEPVPLNGDLALSLVVSQLKDISLRLDSKRLIYKADRITSYELDDTTLSLHFVDGNLTLNSYNTIFQKQKIFATKASRVTLHESNIVISPLWINDQLQVTGYYDMHNKKGDIVAYAEKFSISDAMIDLNSKIDIQTKLDNNEIDIGGTVTLLGGDLHINMDKKSFASDSDIIIVQSYKRKEPSLFMDNLSLSIKIDTKKPLRYRTKDVNIHILADLLVQKSKNDSLLILGTANIMEGSYYRFKNKKFIFKKSLLAFAGDINKPILDIKVLYKSINYDITIQVTGDPQTPNIVFSSIPTLSREQILSVILFDSENAGGGSSGDDMMKMMGGAMAKSALSNIGIKLDHLSIGTDGSVEIGKKISDKITIIYVNDEVSTAKLQYDYDKNIKAVISTDGESSGADIIYRREF